MTEITAKVPTVEEFEKLIPFGLDQYRVLPDGSFEYYKNFESQKQAIGWLKSRAEMFPDCIDEIESNGKLTIDGVVGEIIRPLLDFTTTYLKSIKNAYKFIENNKVTLEEIEVELQSRKKNHS